MPQAVFAAASVLGGGVLTSLVTGAPIIWGSLLARAAIAGGMALLSDALTKKPSQPEFKVEARERSFIVRSSVSPRRVIYGTAVVSGPLVFAASTGSSKEYLHLVIPLAAHQVESIDDVYFNDVPSTDPRFSGYVRINKHLGTPTQVADSDLVAEVPDWTANHRLQGTPYIYVRLKWDQKVFPTGIPNIKALVKGKNDILDPRTALTGWTENAALCQLDYLRSQYGLGCGGGEIDTASWIASANICDESVTLPVTGTQSRYTCNGTFTLDVAPMDILEGLATASAGAIVWKMGKWYGYAGAPITTSFSLNEDDLRGPIRYRPRLARSELFNAVRGTFVNPNDHWQPADFPPVTNATYEAEDGEQIYKDIELPFTNDVYAAQRIAKIDLERVRQGITVDFPAKLSAMNMTVLDAGTLSIDLLGWSNKEFQVVDWRLTEDLGIDLVLREYAPEAWDWMSGEATQVDPAPNTTLPDPFTVEPPTSLVLTPAATVLADGTVVPTLGLTWNPAMDAFVSGYEVEWKQTASSDWSGVKLSGGITATYSIQMVTPGAAYDVRIRSVNTLGISSDWVVTSTTAAGKQQAPNKPTSLAVADKTEAVLLVWNNPSDRDLAYIEIVGSATNDRSTAISISKVLSDTFLDSVPANTDRYYWIRAIDTSGNVSAWEPSGATAGVKGSGLEVDLDAVFDVIRGSVSPSWRNNFEVEQFGDWIDQNGGVIQDVTFFTGNYAGLFTGAGGSALVTAKAPLPEEFKAYMAGKRVRVAFYARKPGANATNAFSVALVDSGVFTWSSFTAPASWTKFEFYQDINSGTTGLEFHVRGDDAGTNKAILLDNVVIEIIPDLITASNISEWIDSAAIGDAYIANAAISRAKIQDLAVDAAKIENLTITSAKIGDNQITVPSSAFTEGSFSVPNDTTWRDAQTLVVSTTGAPVVIQGFACISANSGTQSVGVSLEARLMRDTTVIAIAGASMFGVGNQGTLNIGTAGSVIKDTPSAGTYTYKLQVRRPFVYGLSVSIYASSRSIVATEMKK